MLSFVIIRHVNSKITNLYWIECYKCIRQFYRENPILIVDNNSNYDFITNLELKNTIVINSELKCRGELAGYYYFYKTNISSHAVILQDSMFIKQYIDFGSDVTFLWNFKADYDNPSEIRSMLSLLNNSEALLSMYNNKSQWNGCFSACSVIDRETLQILDEKYNLFVLVNVITNPQYQMAFERVFALLLSSICPTIGNRSFFGDIFDYVNNINSYGWGFTFNNYINNNISCPIVKIWSQRYYRNDTPTEPTF